MPSTLFVLARRGSRLYLAQVDLDKLIPEVSTCASLRRSAGQKGEHNCIGMGGRKYGKIEICDEVSKEITTMKGKINNCFRELLEKQNQKGLEILRKEAEEILTLLPRKNGGPR